MLGQRDSEIWNSGTLEHEDSQCHLNKLVSSETVEHAILNTSLYFPGDLQHLASAQLRCLPRSIKEVSTVLPVERVGVGVPFRMVPVFAHTEQLIHLFTGLQLPLIFMLPH